MACLQEYVMEAMSVKTVLLVTHYVDFLPLFDSIFVGISVRLQLLSVCVCVCVCVCVGATQYTYSS